MKKEKKENTVSEEQPKKKRKILKWILLGILAITVIFGIISFINKQIMKANDEKIINAINELEKEKPYYVFVEINPSMVLTVKNDKVINTACLNNDCIALLSEKTINSSENEINLVIEQIYNEAKAKGFDTSKGVKIKTSNNVVPISFKFATVEIIDEEKQNELLEQVIDNNNIKEKIDVEDYNTKLWNEYKQDKDYGKIYECNLNNKDLECYIKKNMLLGFTVGGADFTKYLPRFYEIFPNLEAIGRVFNKFGIETKGKKELGIFDDPIYNVYINGIEFVISSGDESYLSQKARYLGHKDCNYIQFNLIDLNLLKPNNIKEKYIYDEMKFEEIQKGESEAICGDKLCKIKGYISTNSCDYVTNKIETGVTFSETYKICDINKSNCKEVTKEEFDITSIWKLTID